MTCPTRAVGYRAVLRLPGVPRVFPAAVLGRLSYATVSLSLLLVVEHATGSFAAAGAALGAYAVTGLVMPVKARLIDRFGQRAVLPLLSSGFAVALGATATAAGVGVRSPAAYLGFGTAAGLAAPPLGPSMRALWAALTPGPVERQRAYSLDGVVEESLYSVGPLLVGAVVAVSGAAAALVLTAILNLGGTLAMVTAPAVTGHPGSAGSGSRSSPRPRGTRRPWTGPFRAPGFGLLVAACFGVGLGGGPLEVSLVARAQDGGHPGVAGYLFAALSVGGVAGGLGWGRLRHRRAVSAQLAALVAVLAVGQLAAGIAPGLVSLLVVLVLAGSAGAPVFTVAFLAADALVPAAGRTEASTWVNTGYNVGLALGAAAAGVVVDRAGPTTALLAGAAVLAVVAVGAHAAGRRLDPDRTGGGRPTDVGPTPSG